MKTAFRKHKLLILSAFFGLSAAAVTYATVTPYVQTGYVVVAARDVEQYQLIEPQDLKVVSLPKKAIPRGSYSSTVPLHGAYALSRMQPGQVILDRHVAVGQGEVGLSHGLTADMRCVFVPASYDRAVGGLIKPGEKVDIVFTPKSGTYAAVDLSGKRPSVTVRSLLVLKVCNDESSRHFSGVVVLAPRAAAEDIASYLETCSLSLLLAPRGSETVEEMEPWQPK